MIKGKLGGLKIGGPAKVAGIASKKPIVAINNSIRVEIQIKDRKKNINVEKSWTLQQFKDAVIKEFGYQPEEIECVESVTILPPPKKKKSMYEDEEMAAGSQKTTNTEESE